MPRGINALVPGWHICGPQSASDLTQLSQCPDLDLPDSFARHPKMQSDLPERLYPAVLQAGLALLEEIKRVPAELAAEHPKSARAVAEAASDRLGGERFDKASAEGLVLALGRGLGFEEEPGFWR